MNTQQLKELAQRATPWPWKWFTSNSHNRLSSVASGKDGDVISAFKAADGVPCVSVSRENMGFIEAAHPGAVIELIERLEAAERERDIALSSFCNERLRGDNLDRESQRLSDQLGTCDRERREWIKRAEKAEADIARRDAAARDPFGYMRVVSGLSFQIMEGAARPPDRSGDSVGPWFPIWTTTPQSASVPDGWKLVPVIPTWGMLSSDGCSKHHNGQECSHHENRKRIWSAMLAAAPAPVGEQ